MSEPTPGQKLALCATAAALLIVWIAPMWIAVTVTALTVAVAAASFRWRRQR